jgi:hypothetical protein
MSCLVSPSPLALVTPGACLTRPEFPLPVPQALSPVATSPMLLRLLLSQPTLLPCLLELTLLPRLLPCLLEPTLLPRLLEPTFPLRAPPLPPTRLLRPPELTLPPTVVVLTDQDRAPWARLLLPPLNPPPSSLLPLLPATT